MLPMPPKPVRMLTGFIAAVVLLSAIAMVVLAIAVPPKPLWMVAALEVVVALTCVVAIPLARGGYREGPGLALACVAGAVFMCSALGYFSAQGVVGTVSLKPWIAARVALAGLLGASAAMTVLIRNPKSWGVLVKGVLLGLPPAVMAGLIVLGKAGALMKSNEGAAETIRIGAIMVGGVIMGGLFCASVHFVIRAFEMCRGSTELAPTVASPATASA